MFQPSTSQNSIQQQSQSKKSTGRNKQLDHVNLNQNSKAAAPSQNVMSKPGPRKPFRYSSKQGFSAPREKSFSKNVKKVESRNYKQPSSGQVDVNELLNFQYSSPRQVENQKSYQTRHHSYAQSRRNKT